MNKFYIRDDEQDRVNSDFDDTTRFGEAVGLIIGFALLLVFLAFCATWPNKAHAATTVTRQGGTSDFACCEDADCKTPISPQYARDWAAKDACQALTEADGKTRYFRQWPMRIDKAGAVPPPVVCPPAPASTTRTQTCPAGFTGSWQQTSTSTVGPAPSCTVNTTWAPVDAPAGACAVTPPPPVTPSAPAGLAASFAPNTANPANSNLTLTWTAVPGVTTYEWQRCTGATCTNFGYVAPDATSTTWQNINLPPGIVYRYKVRAFAPVTGPFSDVLTVTVPNGTPPPQANGSATVEWEAPTANTDGSALTNLAGFRIIYGTSADALASAVDVPNAALRTFVVDKLTPGTWYFAVRAYASNGTESAASNIASKVVP